MPSTLIAYYMGVSRARLITDYCKIFLYMKLFIEYSEIIIWELML